MSAISGIEMACWDIAGKFFEVPVSTLLGGRVRDRVRMYANAWFTGARAPEEFAAAAKRTVALGVTALKWDPFGKAHLTLTLAELDRAAAIVGAVREAVGPQVDLLIECHGRFNPYTAVNVAHALAPFRPMFLEEPCPPDNLAAIADVRSKSPVPIAAGERVYTKFGFQDLFDHHAVDIAQPDIFHTGGIYESKKIAAMAEARHIPVSFLATVAVYALISGRAPAHVEILTGGVMIGACFMATDYVTSPITAKGKLVFGFGCGLLCMLIRQFGGYPEGCSFAILIMNAVCPLINRWTQPKPFGAK